MGPLLILLLLDLVLDILFGLLLGDCGTGLGLFLDAEVHADGDSTLRAISMVTSLREAKQFLNRPLNADGSAAGKWADFRSP